VAESEARRQQAARLARLYEASTQREARASKKVFKLSNRLDMLGEELSLLKHAHRSASVHGTAGKARERKDSRATGASEKLTLSNGKFIANGKLTIPERRHEREFWRREYSKAKAKEQSRYKKEAKENGRRPVKQ